MKGFFWYALAGSTEPVSSVEPNQQDFEVVKTVGKALAIGVVVLVALAIGTTFFGAALSGQAVQATVIGTALLLVE